MADTERLKELFARALTMRDPADRNAFLAEACQGDPELRQQLDSLLHAAEQAGGFLEATMKFRRDDARMEGAGTVIGRYKLLEEIGQGGFGVVYMAEQVEPVRRMVAFKIIKAGMDTREVIARFEAERQALALMDHPNIARVLDAGSTDTGRPYFVMELVRGIPITEYCDAENLSSRERLRLFVKVCHAVQHAHQKGVIHRDIKPGNVLVTMHDDEAVPKVIDFGVAKAIGQKLTEKTLFTGFNNMIGTPAYMSPEQAQLSGIDVDTRSDIYSLGVLLYELLTGAPPFEVETFRRAALDEVRRMIQEVDPPKPSTRLQSLGEGLREVARRRDVQPAALTRLVRGDLDWIVMKAMEKDRRRRYDTPDALAEDVSRHLDNEPGSAAAPDTVYRVRKFVRRHRVGITMAASLVLLLAAGVAVSTWQAVRAIRAERAQTTLRVQAEAREKISRAALLARTGDPETAEQTLKSIPPLLAQLDHRDAAAIYAAVGAWRAGRGEWNEAMTNYRRVIDAQPDEFEGYHFLAPLLVRVNEPAAYEELRRNMVVRFGATRDPLVADRLVKDCLILPWSGPEVARLSGLADMAVKEGSSHKAWRRFQFAKGLVEFRQGHYREAGEWMHEVAESGEWSRDINRDVQGYMVLAMANYKINEPSFARSTLVTGLAVARDGLPADSAPFKDLPTWNDWIISHVLMDEARLLIEGPAGLVGDASATEPRPDAHVESSPLGAQYEKPAAAVTSPASGNDVASPGPGTETVARVGNPSSSLTVLPLRLGGQPVDRLAEVVGLLIEQSGLESVELGSAVFDPGGNTGMDALQNALGAFLTEHPVSTDYALYAEYNGVPGKGINELRAVLLDRAGRVAWSERLTADDEPFRQLENPDPMNVSILLVNRLSPVMGLNEETRRLARPGRIARLFEERSGVPPESERAAISDRQKTMKDARRTLTLLVFPARANGAVDATSAGVLAQVINEAGLCRAIVSPGAAAIEPTQLVPDELKMLWTLARSFQGYVRQTHPDADYLLLADYSYYPERWEIGLVHFVVCNRQGDWVIVDLQNSEQQDYQAIKPTSSAACSRLVVRRLAGYLD
jgi:serine/threonine protein kinase